MSNPRSPWGLPSDLPGRPVPPPYGRPERDPDRRPGEVLMAGVVTLVLAGLTLLAALATLVVSVLARGDLVDGIDRGLNADERDLVSGSDLATVVLVLAAVLATWCLVAIGLAVLTLRRSNTARYLLIVSAGLAALLSLVCVLFLYVTLLTLAGAVAVVVLLARGDAARWFAARPAGSRRPGAATPPR